MAEGLAGLFDPGTVAVVGATDREGSVGRAIVENLRPFDGAVWLVNPNNAEVLGRETYDDLASLPEPPGLVVVAVPPDAVVDVVREAGEVGVEHVVVVTAGFGESGTRGAARERALREVATEYELNLVGPNCLGVMSTPERLNATFGPSGALPGSISLMSQSGAFVTAILDWAADRGIGFKDVVSLGNKAVLDETDFLETWNADPDTSVVVGYLESIEDGRAFLDRAREVTADTPVVLVKAGRTEAGAQAASSHTGAIAGSERAYEAALDQSGVLRADTVEELFDVATALEDLSPPENDAVGIVTNAGGPGVLCTDAVGDSSLRLASLSETTVDALDADLPPGANLYNPVDVVGDADVERFRVALEAVLADDGVGSAVVLAAPTAVLDFGELAEAVAAVEAESDEPLVACLMGGDRTVEAAETLAAAGVPSYFDPARAVRSLDALARYGDVRSRTYESPTTFDVDREAAREVLSTVADRDTNRLGVEAMNLLSAYGIDTPAGEVVDDARDAVDVAREIDGPVAMKIVSPDVLHKSDIGGVRVDVDLDDVADVYEELVTRTRNYQPDATILGVQVQEMVDLSGATETIVGLNRDPQFGPVVLFGLGGIFVEVLEDTSLRVAPVSEREATDMVEEIRAAPLLHGARGREPADRGAIKETIQRLSQLAVDFPAVLELDVNPLVAGPRGVTALDVRLTVDPSEL